MTITCANSGSTTRGVLFAEWTVTGGTVAFDKQGSHGQTASTTQTTPATGTLSSAAEIIIGYFATGVAAQTFAISGSGAIEYTSANTTVDSCVTDLYVSATTSVTQAITSNSSTSVNGIVTFAFTQSVVATPTFSPVAGTYTGTQTVTVSDTNSGLAGFAMYYTTDGSTPTTGSTLYTGAISVSTSQTLKVLAVATGYANSAIASAAYIINSAGGGSGKGLSLAMDASLRLSGVRH